MALAAPRAEKFTSGKALTDLPIELIQEVAKHVHGADLCALHSANRCLHAATHPFFREAFFTDRRHKVTHKGLETLFDLTRIDHLCKNLKSITFELVACVNVELELLVYILGAFKNLHERGNRLSVGVDASKLSEDEWNWKSSEYLARFIGKILTLSASTQCLTKIFVMLHEEITINNIWDDRRIDAICAHLAAGNDLSFLWPGVCDIGACYKSKDNSLILGDIIPTRHTAAMVERIRDCIDEEIIKPIEKVHLEECFTSAGYLIQFMGLFPEIKELSVVKTTIGAIPNEDWKWHYFLEAVMEMENLEVLLLKDNEIYWNGVSPHTNLCLRDKQNIREGLQREITELKAGAN